MTPQETTHFGFQTTTPQEKTQRVKGVFDSVASRYDLMNDVMSGGMHRLWKRHFVGTLPLHGTRKILDLAGGTGDISFAIAKRSAAEITVCDINAAMLEVGKTRPEAKNTHLEWLCASAESLPCPSNHFDLCTMSFGIRNVTNIPAALAEIYRVLKPASSFACLEFSHVSNPLLKPMYERYSFGLIPTFGKLIGGDRDAYQYLVESIRKFPTQPVFATMLEDAGFKNVSYRNLNGGIVAIHTGWKV